MNRFICIHGHFYQPPRENPWLEKIEVQDSAFPYHDWNERITAECYGPNSASRILDEQKRIIDIVNNYSKISYNFGPTLLSWMEKKEPEVYKAILDADKDSQNQYSGHGSALAQAYNHMIMPLANTRDKRTQILWGIKDFENRFGRKPEGMWLPETGVDMETLDIMAEQEIKFTILAPNQASRVRKMGDEGWTDVSGGRIDPKKPYLCSLPSGRAMNIFFYDGPVSRDIAFGDLLKNGEAFAQRLSGSFSQKEEENPLVHIATDGETYGHHNRFGDMALAYCIHLVESQNLAQCTVYGEYLENFPPTHEVEIMENSSWSCVHGVERWRSDCGCATGMNPDWNQKWRSSLREAMDWLREQLVGLFEREVSRLLKDPWEARNLYIEVLLDRSEEKVNSFLSEHQNKALSPEEKVRALKLMEMQRNAMLMYTSCGWFFDDISGIETVQIIQYAARAMQLAREVNGKDYEPEYKKILERASSNLSEYKNGAWIYENFVQPALLDLTRVGIHYAISSLFEQYPETIKMSCYTVNSRDYEIYEAGKQKLAVGWAQMSSDITWDQVEVSFAVLHFGDHNLAGGIRAFKGEEAFSTMKEEVKEAFQKGDVTGCMNLMDQYFGTHSYSLWHLFRDEKRKVMNQVMDSTLKEIESSFRQIYESHYPTMQAMKDMHIPLPQALLTPMEIILNADLQKLLMSEDLNLPEIQKIGEEFRKWDLEPRRGAIPLRANQHIESLMKKLSQDPSDLSVLENLEVLFHIMKEIGVELDLWRSQNLFFAITQKVYSKMEEKLEKGDEEAEKWIQRIQNVGNYLGVKIK